MTWPDLTPPRLQVQTTPAEHVDPLLSLLPAVDAYAWVRNGDGMVGWGEAARHKADSIGEAEEWWRDLAANVEVCASLDDAPAGAGLMAFGSFVFDPDNTAARSTLVVPRVVLGRRGGRSWVTRVKLSTDPDWPELPTASVPQRPRGVKVGPGALSGEQWQAAVARAVSLIAEGRLDKVVLARDLVGSAETEIDPRWIAGRLARDYTRCWTYLVDGLVGATPEMLVRRERGLATSRILAGTIRRTGDDEHDLNLAAALSRSSKDLEEHEYAVSSVAQALAPFCSGLHVPDAPYVLELPNLLHLATDVTAVADRGASSLALAAALHPSAAVCGTPTVAARALVAELEHLDRERYAGPVGWVDGSGDGEWAIALRCGQILETDPRQIRLFAGCGIVAGSDPADELAESAAKLVPMRDALGG
ncbi:MAG: menF [Friedmanniella sp.]|nr:menF [Friedmanniella sp.]